MTVPVPSTVLAGLGESRLREHLAVGRGAWSATQSLTDAEVYTAVSELLALREAVSDTHRILEACLAVAVKADPMDAPMPLIGAEASIWHRARMEAFRHALEMLPARSLPTIPEEASK